MDLRIRPIGGDEWRLWRSLRLRAVEDSPDAFRSSLSQESAEADEWWIELIKQAAGHPNALLLVAEAGPDPVGMLFGRLDDGDELLLDIGAMWVDPDARRKGVGRALLQSALSWAQDAGAKRAELWVTPGNDAARRLLVGAGFELTEEREPLRSGSELIVAKAATRLG